MTHPQPLPPDAPRCEGKNCEAKVDCIRYIQKDDGSKKPAPTWNPHNVEECFYMVRAG